MTDEQKVTSVYTIIWIDADGKKQVTSNLDVHQLQNAQEMIVVMGGVVVEVKSKIK